MRHATLVRVGVALLRRKDDQPLDTQVSVASSQVAIDVAARWSDADLQRTKSDGRGHCSAAACTSASAAAVLLRGHTKPYQPCAC